MKRESKELLLKDLCARLPYGVICEFYDGKRTIVKELGIGGLHDFMFGNMDAKPYLHPMSSITEEEKEEFNSLISGVEERCINAYGKGGYTLAFIEVNDWLNAHHFDFRNFIGRGLAIDCTSLNVY